MLKAASLFIFLLTATLSHAAPDTAKVHRPATLVIDTGTVAQRTFDKTAIEKLKRQPEFDYQQNYSGPSLWTRFWKWFWSLFETSGGGKALGWFLISLKWLILIGGPLVIVLIILKLTGIDPLSIFRRQPYTSLAYSESEENIHEIDFDAEIEKAVSVNNYRLAVRLLYLRCLKQLSDSELINWQINKTNTNYINELTDNIQKDTFKQLTRQFEYAWYGDFLITAESYRKISQMFNNFKSNAS
ncbi:DUF4129 domain-containing protein [Mucilaginibacter terrenus]|uniref:DUF4129 domain-containing protein n=1 Tax=Mucilaginibacter terrenus TaxID=2482727 RepID=A0A3E2NJT8_9SPHI|nr:DUF4129 domain-containing protein [Mucilaginibacter terrenus]RFZ81201.1 DUF4129 domain-containing protein [Mucilaginibacter terrenus]